MTANKNDFSSIEPEACKALHSEASPQGNTDLPLVSIIIPCYNAENYVAEAIQSALDQTYPNCEVIVIDDGSTDGSLGVIEGFGDRIRWETGPNRGGCAARNRGVEAARGGWIQFLDSDDLLLEGKIENQLKCSCEADLVYGPYDLDSVDCPDIVTWPRAACSPDLETLVDQWLDSRFAQTNTMLWRRESLLALGGWDESYSCCQDNELSLRAVMAGVGICYCPKVDSIYRRRKFGTVSTENLIRFEKIRVELLTRLCDWLDGKGVFRAAYRKKMSLIVYCLIKHLAKEGAIKEAGGVEERCRTAGIFRMSDVRVDPVYTLTYRLLGLESAEKLMLVGARILRK